MGLVIEEKVVAEGLDPYWYHLSFGKVMKHLTKFKQIEVMEMATTFTEDIVDKCDVTEIEAIHMLFITMATQLERYKATNTPGG